MQLSAGERRSELMSALQMERSSVFTVHYHFLSLPNHNAMQYVSAKECFLFLCEYIGGVCVWEEAR